MLVVWVHVLLLRRWQAWTTHCPVQYAVTTASQYALNGDELLHQIAPRTPWRKLAVAKTCTDPMWLSVREADVTAVQGMDAIGGPDHDHVVRTGAVTKRGDLWVLPRSQHGDL